MNYMKKLALESILAASIVLTSASPLCSTKEEEPAKSKVSYALVYSEGKHRAKQISGNDNVESIKDNLRQKGYEAYVGSMRGRKTPMITSDDSKKDLMKRIRKDMGGLYGIIPVSGSSTKTFNLSQIQKPEEQKAIAPPDNSNVIVGRVMDNISWSDFKNIQKRQQIEEFIQNSNNLYLRAGDSGEEWPLPDAEAKNKLKSALKSQLETYKGIKATLIAPLDSYEQKNIPQNILPPAQSSEQNIEFILAKTDANKPEAKKKVQGSTENTAKGDVKAEEEKSDKKIEINFDFPGQGGISIPKSILQDPDSLVLDPSKIPIITLTGGYEIQPDRSNIEKNVSSVAKAIEEYKNKSGKYPLKLKDVAKEYRGNIEDFADPFLEGKGKPLTYISDGEDFLVYSYGMDGVNNAGIVLSITDLTTKSGRRVIIPDEIVRYSTEKGYKRLVKSIIEKHVRDLKESEDSLKRDHEEAMMKMYRSEKKDYSEIEESFNEFARFAGDYRKKEGKYPSLAELKKLMHPIFFSDRLCNGESFRYFSNGEDYLIYSIGRDCKDNHGAVERVIEVDGKKMIIEGDISKTSNPNYDPFK